MNRVPNNVKRVQDLIITMIAKLVTLDISNYLMDAFFNVQMAIGVIKQINLVKVSI